MNGKVAEEWNALSRLRLRLSQLVSPRLRRARSVLAAELGDFDGDLFLVRSWTTSESEITQQIHEICRLLERGERRLPGVVPGLLVGDVADEDSDLLAERLRNLASAVAGRGKALAQEWAKGDLRGNGYHVTVYACLFSPSGGRLLWRRSESLIVVDSRSTAGRKFNPWKPRRWVS